MRQLENPTIACRNDKNLLCALGFNLFVFLLRNGSVIANFSIEYREISTVEVITLATYLDEKKLLGTMPILDWYINTTEGK